LELFFSAVSRVVNRHEVNVIRVNRIRINFISLSASHMEIMDFCLIQSERN